MTGYPLSEDTEWLSNQVTKRSGSRRLNSQLHLKYRMSFFAFPETLTAYLSVSGETGPGGVSMTGADEVIDQVSPDAGKGV